MAKRFWMCYVTGANVPNVVHDTAEKADAEAERLARQSPDHRVYVLEAVRMFEVEEAPVRSESCEDPTSNYDEMIP